MKKLGIFVMCLATAAMTLVGCKKGNGTSGETPEQPAIVEDGFYVIGEATVVTDFKAANAAIELMGQGFNEVDKQYREGMYEKYIALEGGKDFELVLYKAGEETHYGAALKEDSVDTDAAPAKVLKGLMAKDTKMKVAKNGFYHIILDLNVKEDLADGAQIIVVECHWGVMGDMTAWSKNMAPTKEATFNKETMTWTWEEVMEQSDGSFKFRHGDCWKYNLDKQGKVKAENSLGTTASNDGDEECLPTTKNFGGGKNYGIKSGIYTITLTWNLKSGAVGESFVAEAKRTGDVPFIDYSEFELDIVGAAVADQAGAEPDDIWSWGNKLPVGKPVRNGDDFVWTKEHVTLIGGQEFKVRAQGVGEIPGFDFGEGGTGANAKAVADGNYTIEASINGKTGKKDLVVTAE